MKLKILCLDDILSENSLKEYLGSPSKYDLLVSIKSPMTGEVVRISERRFQLYKKQIKAYYYNNSIPSTEMDILIFPAIQYERARLYSESYPFRMVVVVHEDFLSYEKKESFYVADWKQISDILHENYLTKNGKHQSKDSKSSDSKSRSKSATE